METTFIYTLTDPRTKLIRYIGKANNLKERFKAHKNPCHNITSYKRNWINQLRELGLEPIINIIDIVPIEEWQFWEQYWYWQLRSWGFSLVNHTTCGDGLTFGNKTTFKKGSRAKKIIAIGFDKDIKGKYFSVREAISKTGLSHIPNAIKKEKQLSAGKMLWYYKEDWLVLTKEQLDKDIARAKDTSNKGSKINRFQKGSLPWNKGIIGYTTSKQGYITPQETRDKISQTLKNKHNDNSIVRKETGR